MKVVVGLGNPGVKYQRTRHNVGFLVLGELARRHGAGGTKVKFEAEVAEAVLAGQSLLLVAPQTYMNASGRCVRKLVDFYELPSQDLLVICDDFHLELGRLRLRPSGSAGGQKGLQDIIGRLGTQEFARLRVGIGTPPPRIDPADYVLSRFRTEERDLVDEAVKRAADGAELWVTDGLQAAMNRVNAPGPHSADD